MRGFSPGKRGFDMAAAIFRVRRDAEFTYEQIVQAGIQVHPGNLAKLRNDGILMHPPDEAQSQTGLPRRRQHQHGPKTWLLTPDAVRTLKRYPEEVEA